MSASFDRNLGRILATLATFVWVYWTLWLWLPPFMDIDIAKDWFPAPELALVIPLILGCVLLSFHFCLAGVLYLYFSVSIEDSKLQNQQIQVEYLFKPNESFTGHISEDLSTSKKL